MKQILRRHTLHTAALTRSSRVSWSTEHTVLSSYAPIWQWHTDRVVSVICLKLSVESKASRGQTLQTGHPPASHSCTGWPSLSLAARRSLSSSSPLANPQARLPPHKARRAPSLARTQKIYSSTLAFCVAFLLPFIEVSFALHLSVLFLSYIMLVCACRHE